MRTRIALLCLALGLVYCSDDKKPPGGGDDPCAALACDNNTTCAVVDGTATCVCNDDCSAPTITAPEAALADITIDAAATSVTLTASGAAPFTWAVTAGALPAGMSLATTGVYSGTPTTLGEYNFTVTVTSAFGSDSRAFTQTVVTPPANAYLLLTAARLVPFHLGYLSALADPIQLTGVTAGEELVAIDRRPLNNMLYALGVNATNNTLTLYNVIVATKMVVPVGAVSTGMTTDGATVVDLPTGRWDIDFNPAADRLRVVAGSLNFRMNPNTGAVIDGDNTGLTNGAVGGFNPDGAMNGGTTIVDGVAYTNDSMNASLTTLYALDGSTNSLFLVNPPNGGTATNGVSVTLSGSPIDFQVAGFDLLEGVNAQANNMAVESGSAHAVIVSGGQTLFVQINLTNGQATVLTALPHADVVSFAIYGDAPLPVVALSGSNLIRFTATAPTAIRTIALTGLTASEILVGADIRQRTGQLYGLGVNAGADNATLYLIDPQTGAMTAVGSAGLISADLPDTSLVRYDLDFNNGVDRLRVITSNGQQWRINPTNGTLAATDTTMTGAILPQAVAYAGSGGVAGVENSTALVIDTASHGLFLMNPPNAGVLTSVFPFSEGTTPVNFTECRGFDLPVPSGVSGANVVPARGVGYALFVYSTKTYFYAIDLANGALTRLAELPGAPSGLAVGAMRP